MRWIFNSQFRVVILIQSCLLESTFSLYLIMSFNYSLFSRHVDHARCSMYEIGVYTMQRANYYLTRAPDPVHGNTNPSYATNYYQKMFSQLWKVFHHILIGDSIRDYRWDCLVHVVNNNWRVASCRPPISYIHTSRMIKHAVKEGNSWGTIIKIQGEGGSLEARLIEVTTWTTVSIIQFSSHREHLGAALPQIHAATILETSATTILPTSITWVKNREYTTTVLALTAWQQSN